MKSDDRSKLQSYISEIAGLKSRQPDLKKFKTWRENVEKKLDDAFGKNSPELGGFKRLKLSQFAPDESGDRGALSESQRRDYVSALEKARQYLTRII